MGHSQAAKTESRQRILDIASRQIRAEGLESVSIADLMKAADLTHGGFYGHFPSRAALLAAALEAAIDDGNNAFSAAQPQPGPVSPATVLKGYLSPLHRDNPAEGCAFGALATDVARSADPAIREKMLVRTEESVDRITEAFGGSKSDRDKALEAWSSMIGALTLARLCKGSNLSDDFLAAGKRALERLTENT